MRIIKIFLALVVAFLHLALTLIMAMGFLAFLIPGVVFRYSLKQWQLTES
jgi:hypothetical protein